MTQVKVVLFDLDDTLWDLVRTMQRAHQEWAASVSELPGGALLAEAHSDWRSWTDASQTFADIKRDRPDLGKNLPLIRKEALRLACVSQGLDPELFVERGFAAWTDARNRPVFFAGAVDLVAALKAKGMVVGAVSDGFADLEKIPEISKYIDFAVFAKDVGASKPDPKIFKVAISKAEEVLKAPCNPAECVMVGDSYQKDVLGAKDAGMRTVWFDNPGSFPRAECGQACPEPPLSCDHRMVMKALFLGHWKAAEGELPKGGDPGDPDEKLITITEDAIKFDHGGGRFANGKYAISSNGKIEKVDGDTRISFTISGSELLVKYEGGRYSSNPQVVRYEKVDGTGQRGCAGKCVLQ